MDVFDVATLYSVHLFLYGTDGGTLLEDNPDAVRGGQSAPGEFRGTQNWIGPAGCRIDDATYVPPPPPPKPRCGNGVIEPGEQCDGDAVSGCRWGCEPDCTCIIKTGGWGKGGSGKLFVNGKPVGDTRISRTAPAFFSIDESFDVGTDTGSPVGDYTTKYAFTGTIRQVTVELR